MERRDLAGIVAKHGLEVTVTYRILHRAPKGHNAELRALTAANKVVDHYFREMMGWAAR